MRSPTAATRTRSTAQAEGKFDEEIVPFEIRWVTRRTARSPKSTKTVFAKDEGPRADTTPEALAKLKPVFHANGTVTAGNSSQTSDGAAAAIVMSDTQGARAGVEAHGALRQFRYGRRAAGDHGHRTVVAIPKALALAGLKLDDIG